MRWENIRRRDRFTVNLGELGIDPDQMMWVPVMTVPGDWNNPWDPDTGQLWTRALLADNPNAGWRIETDPQWLRLHWDWVRRIDPSLVPATVDEDDGGLFDEESVEEEKEEVNLQSGD